MLHLSVSNKKAARLDGLFLESCNWKTSLPTISSSKACPVLFVRPEPSSLCKGFQRVAATQKKSLKISKKGLLSHKRIHKILVKWLTNTENDP